VRHALVLAQPANQALLVKLVSYLKASINSLETHVWNFVHKTPRFLLIIYVLTAVKIVWLVQNRLMLALAVQLQKFYHSIQKLVLTFALRILISKMDQCAINATRIAKLALELWKTVHLAFQTLCLHLIRHVKQVVMPINLIINSKYAKNAMKTVSLAPSLQKIVVFASQDFTKKMDTACLLVVLGTSLTLKQLLNAF